MEAYKLKDILYLYLGCEVFGTYNDQSGSKGYLTGITNGGQDCEIQFFEEDGINVSEEPEFNDIAEIKPILRPLSDMTEDEIRHFVWVNMDSETHLDSDSRVSAEEIEIESEYQPDHKRLKIVVSCRCFEGTFFIDSNGDTRLYDDNDEGQPIDHQLENFLYLIKQGFDLFGLHESGQCIYKNDLK